MKRIKQILKYVVGIILGLGLLLLARKPRTVRERPVDETAPTLDENAEQLKQQAEELEGQRQEVEDSLAPLPKNEHTDVDSAVADWNEKR